MTDVGVLYELDNIFLLCLHNYKISLSINISFYEASMQKRGIEIYAIATILFGYLEFQNL